MRSAQGTEAGNSTAVFNPKKDNEQELRVNAFLTDDVRQPPVPRYVLLVVRVVVGLRHSAKTTSSFVTNIGVVFVNIVQYLA